MDAFDAVVQAMLIVEYTPHLNGTNYISKVRLVCVPYDDGVVCYVRQGDGEQAMARAATEEEARSMALGLLACDNVARRRRQQHKNKQKQKQKQP
jgi:hypothetical protein